MQGLGARVERLLIDGEIPLLLPDQVRESVKDQGSSVERTRGIRLPDALLPQP